MKAGSLDSNVPTGVVRLCDGWTGNDIQACINSANFGDTIALVPGRTYVATKKILINRSGITLTTFGNPVCFNAVRGVAELTGNCATILADPTLSFAVTDVNISGNGGVLQMGPDILWADVNGNQFIPPKWQSPIYSSVIENIVVDGNKPSRPADFNPTGLAACRYGGDHVSGPALMGQLGCANVRINNCENCDVKNMVTMDGALK